MSNNKVSLLDRLLAIPVIVYFEWYKWRQKRGNSKEES